VLGSGFSYGYENVSIIFVSGAAIYTAVVVALCMILFRGMHLKHIVQREIWVPIQDLLWDPGKLL
jgi:hypothetical protein